MEALEAEGKTACVLRPVGSENHLGRFVIDVLSPGAGFVRLRVDSVKSMVGMAMQVNVPPDLETLINKRLSSGSYLSVEDVLRSALEAQDAEEAWTDEERSALASHIEQGYQQAERGELIAGDQARREIQAMKDAWRDKRLARR